MQSSIVLQYSTKSETLLTLVSSRLSHITRLASIDQLHHVVAQDAEGGGLVEHGLVHNYGGQVAAGGRLIAKKKQKLVEFNTKVNNTYVKDHADISGRAVLSGAQEVADDASIAADSVCVFRLQIIEFLRETEVKNTAILHHLPVVKFHKFSGTDNWPLLNKNKYIRTVDH